MNKPRSKVPMHRRQDAAEQGFKRASRTLRGITGLQIEEQTAHAENGKITEYRVRMHVTFILDE